MKNKLSCLGKATLFVFLLAGTVFSFVQAEENLSIEVNLRNTAMSYEDNQVAIFFDLTNGQGTQSGIKYGVHLLKDGMVIDEKIYDKVISLKEDEVLSQKVKYMAPNFLQGEYSLQLVVENEAGVPLSFETVGSVILNGTNQYLFIDSNSCYALVPGEEKHYALDDGVDVSAEEKLMLNCLVSNYFAETIEFVSTFETYRRSIFGEQTEVELPNQEVVSLEAGETKELSFEIPKAITPQAYDAVLSLTKKNQSQTKISNLVVLHYVMRGGSATIQNIQLDKDVYLAGETAQVSFFWTPSADSFYGARSEGGTILEDIVIEGQIEGCSDIFYHNPTENPSGLVTIEVPILKDCQLPQVSLTVKSGEQLLDEAFFEVNQNYSSLSLIIISLVIIILIFGVVLFSLKKRGMKTTSIVLFFLLGIGAVLGGTNVVEAATWVSGQDPLRLPIGWVTYTYNYDNSSNIGVGFSGTTYTACNNNGEYPGMIKVYHDGVLKDEITKNKSVSFAKSIVVGTHTVQLDFYLGTGLLAKDCYNVETYWGSSCQTCGFVGCTDKYNCDFYHSTGTAEVPVCYCYNKIDPVPYPDCKSFTCTYSEYMGLTDCGSGFKYSKIGSKTYTYTIAEQTPTCSVEWTNASGSPVTSVLTTDQAYFKLNTTNATSVSYEATGPSTANGSILDYNTKTMFGPYTFNSAGTELIKITVENSSGVKGYCNASLLVNSVLIPTCIVKFTPSKVTVPGGSDLIWSSSNAVSAEYLCTGLQPGTEIWQPIGTSGTSYFNFTASDAGQTETCTLSVTSSSGQTNTCSGSVNLSSSPVYACTINGVPTNTLPDGYVAWDTEENTGLTANIPWTYSDSDTMTKCQYRANYACTGSRPSGIEVCLNDESGLTSNVAWLDVGDIFGCTEIRKCQYYTPCEIASWEPDSATVCVGINFTQISNCGTTRTTTGTKACPTCTANFSPASITSPGSSQLTWSSLNATDIKYTCVGSLPSGADYGSIPLNSPGTPTVMFNFPFGPIGVETCTFTVKDNDGEVNTCQTNVQVTPHKPTCSLESSEDVVFLGDSTILSWTSTYANSAEIDRGVGAISPFIASSSKTVYPIVSVTSGINYVGTFSSYGNSTDCSTDLITVVVDPPEIGDFKVSNQKTGGKPTAEWITQNAARCDLETDTGYLKLNVCSSESDCASVSDFEINKTITEETTYTLTCYHDEGYSISLDFTPLAYFVLSADPTEVEVDFAGGGAWTESEVALSIVSWNGYNSLISFSAGLSGLPESPGTEINNEATFAPQTLKFSDYFYGTKSMAKFFASYRFVGNETITVKGNNLETVNITIGAKKTVPVYEPL